MALVLGCSAGLAADYLRFPQEFVGTYLANRSSESCMRKQRAGLATPAYLVVQSDLLRYGYRNPKDDHSLETTVCRAIRIVRFAEGDMEVQSRCFMIDRLAEKNFRFTKRAGILWLRDLDSGTEDEFEACF